MEHFVGEVDEGKCLECDRRTLLRYEGVQGNPIRKTNKPMYTCEDCNTARVYDGFLGEVA